MKDGLYVVLEGLPRSGKTSNLELARPHIEERWGNRVYFTKEPGGTDVGNLIREIVLRPQLKMHPVTEAYLMAAARGELRLVCHFKDLGESWERKEWLL